MTMHIHCMPKSNRFPVAILLLLLATALSTGCASRAQPVAQLDPVAELILGIVLAVPLLLVLGGVLRYFLKNYIWRSIRDSARIYAAHFIREFTYSGDIEFRYKEGTSWNGHSFSHERMDVQLSILGDMFALSGTALLTGVAKTFTLPRSDVWASVFTAAFYIIIFLPVYFVGAKWIGSLTTTVLHYPKDELLVRPRPGQFRWLLAAGALTAAWCGVLFRGISAEPPPLGQWSTLFIVTLGGTLLAIARFAATVFKQDQLYPPKYFSPDDTREHLLEDVSFEEIEQRRRALTAEICGHPALTAWQASLPPGPRQIAGRLLEGYARMDLLAEADACSKEELRENPFLLSLLYGSPETLTYTGIVDALSEIRNAVRSYQCLSVFHLPAAPA